MDRDRGRRYDDGEVVRYGAGESWRPTPRGGSGSGSVGDRSPRRATRSPTRDRERLPPRSPRARSPRPRSPMGPSSDSYVPGGRYPPPPRRRSISPGERFRRDRSRDRESPRRRERSRSPMRRSPPPPSRRSPSRRGSPIRDGRPRSPRRDWGRDRDWDNDRMRDRDRDFDRRDRRMSRSPPPYAQRRDRSPPGPGRSPLGGGPPYRPRSRSPHDRYQSYRRPSPPRDSGISSTINSRPTSERASPRPGSIRGRSPLPSRDHSPRYSGPAPRSPPRGPAALQRGPGGSGAPWGTPPAQISPQPRHQSIPGPYRSETSSPTNAAPSGPRGYFPPSSRGGYSSRGRGGWSSSSRPGLSPGPSTPTGIPTGPRSGISSGTGSSTPTHGRPFNPPTGPASHGSGPRQSLSQSLMASMPPIIPGGKLDSAMLPLVMGVTREVEPHFRKLRDEEEKLREELRVKQERLRKSVTVWNRLERDAAAWELRSDLSEKSMKSLAGEGMGGAAF